MSFCLVALSSRQPPPHRPRPPQHGLDLRNLVKRLGLDRLEIEKMVCRVTRCEAVRCRVGQGD